jgi:high-affinity nickel-transport protein
VTPFFGDWKLDAALGSCLLLGLRHGFDYDHLAAISDITAVQRNWWSGLRLGITYALGHACMIALMGVTVLEMHFELPGGIDAWAEKLIGLTLIVLGIGVVAGIYRKPDASHPHDHHRVDSRLAIAINGVIWIGWKLRRLFGSDAPRPKHFHWIYNGKSVFAIGMLHGIGAETPSQLTLFFLTANLGGTSRGLLGLFAFTFGLVVMNGIMTASMGGAFAPADTIRTFITPSPGPARHIVAFWVSSFYLASRTNSPRSASPCFFAQNSPNQTISK